MRSLLVVLVLCICAVAGAATVAAGVRQGPITPLPITEFVPAVNSEFPPATPYPRPDDIDRYVNNEVEEDMRPTYVKKYTNPAYPILDSTWFEPLPKYSQAALRDAREHDTEMLRQAMRQRLIKQLQASRAFSEHVHEEELEAQQARESKLHSCNNCMFVESRCAKHLPTGPSSDQLRKRKPALKNMLKSKPLSDCVEQMILDDYNRKQHAKFEKKQQRGMHVADVPTNELRDLQREAIQARDELAHRALIHQEATHLADATRKTAKTSSLDTLLLDKHKQLFEDSKHPVEDIVYEAALSAAARQALRLRDNLIASIPSRPLSQGQHFESPVPSLRGMGKVGLSCTIRDSSCQMGQWQPVQSVPPGQQLVGSQDTIVSAGKPVFQSYRPSQ